MTPISVCPHCQALLALPAGAPHADRVACPACSREYSLDISPLREPLVAQIVTIEESLEPAATLTAHDAPTVADVSALGVDLDQLIAKWSGPLDQGAPPKLEPADVTPAAQAVSEEEVRGPSVVWDQLAAAPIETNDANSAAAPLPEVASLGASTEPPKFEYNFESLASKLAPPPQPAVEVDELELSPTFEPLPDRSANEEHVGTSFEAVAEDADGEPAHHGFEAVDDDLVETRRERRRGSPLRTLVGVGVSGVLGILLGGYGLLYFGGPSRDLLKMSSWLPAGLLPPGSGTSSVVMSPAPAPFPAADVAAQPPAETVEEAKTSMPPPLAETPETEAPVDDTADSTTPPVDQVAEETPRYDPAVALATAQHALAPAEQPADGDSATDADDERVWPTTPVVSQLRHADFFKVADLQEATAAAETALPQILDGDLSKPETVPRMGQGYIAMCAVAERLTLLDPDESSPSLAAAQAEANRILGAAVYNPAQVRDLGVIAGRWLEHDKRRNDGILFTGKVVATNAASYWTEQTMAITVGDRKVEIPVLMHGDDLKVGDEAVVAGVIVEQPSESLSDYPGSAPQAVIAGSVFAPRGAAK